MPFCQPLFSLSAFFTLYFPFLISFCPFCFAPLFSSYKKWQLSVAQLSLWIVYYILTKNKLTEQKLCELLEAPPRFELGHRGFADLCLTTWLWRLIWSGLRGSNSLPPPWQGGALPDELHPHFIGASGRNRTTDTGIFSPLLYRLSYRGKNWRPGTGSNRRPLAWQASVLTNWTTGPNVVGTTGLEPVTLCL